MTGLVSIIFLLISLLTKFIFWFLLPEKKVSSFLKSFFRWYTIYDMHDAPNSNVAAYWRISNICNFIAYTSAIILISYGYIKFSDSLD
jgi:hypothetical protein